MSLPPPRIHDGIGVPCVCLHSTAIGLALGRGRYTPWSQRELTCWGGKVSVMDMVFPDVFTPFIYYYYYYYYYYYCTEDGIGVPCVLKTLHRDRPWTLYPVISWELTCWGGEVSVMDMVFPDVFTLFFTTTTTTTTTTLLLLHYYCSLLPAWHTYIYTYIHTYIHTYIPTYIHTYIQGYSTKPDAIRLLINIFLKVCITQGASNPMIVHFHMSETKVWGSSGSSGSSSSSSSRVVK